MFFLSDSIIIAKSAKHYAESGAREDLNNLTYLTPYMQTSTFSQLKNAILHHASANDISRLAIDTLNQLINVNHYDR